MLEEIAEQPAALAQTIREERGKIARLGRFLKERDIDLIVLVARGSSDNAALFGRYLLEITTGIPVSLSAPSVHTLYGAKLKLQKALVIGVSQSGEGEDINRVLENARACGAHTVGITNEAASAMVSLVDETLLMHGGRERSVAATKTFTGQMMLFYMLAAELADRDVGFQYDLSLNLRHLPSNRSLRSSNWFNATSSWKTAWLWAAVSPMQTLTSSHSS